MPNIVFWNLVSVLTIAIFYMRVAGMRCGKGSEVCKVLFWARVASVWSPSEARVLKKPQVTRKDTLHISDPFSVPNLGTPNIEYYFFKLQKHFRTPPPGMSCGVKSRPPIWPRPLNVATPTKHFSLILMILMIYYLMNLVIILVSDSEPQPLRIQTPLEISVMVYQM